MGSQRRGARWLSVALRAFVLGFLLLGVLFLALRFVSYEKARAIFDWYVARRGSHGGARNILSLEAYGHFVRRLPIAAGILEICGIVLAWFRKSLTEYLLGLPGGWREFRSYFERQFHRGTELYLELGGVLVVTGIGFFLRLHHLWRPARFDEAWTYMDFAARPLALVVSRYPAPNNHLLNTLLVHFSTIWFGNTLLGLRLPALVAGCLVMVAAWLVTRALYGPVAGILAAGCVAALPTFVEFSVNARGYSLQWLCVLGVMLFGAVILEGGAKSWAWLGLVMAAVAGIYAIPTTVLGVAGIFCWMLANVFWNEKAEAGGGGPKQLVRKVCLASLAIGLLSLLLYLPPLLVSGPSAMAAQSVVALQQRIPFADGLRHMAGCTWVYWTEGVPGAVIWILLVGLVIGLAVQRKIGKQRLAIFPAMVVIAGLFILGMQVYGFPRVWSYLLLCGVMTAAAGISVVLEYLVGRSQIRRIGAGAIVAVVLAAWVAAAIVKQKVLWTTNEPGTVVDAGEVAKFLAAELRPGDALVSNALIEYELVQRDQKLYVALAKPQNAKRVVVVVMKRIGDMEICSSEEQMAALAAQDVADPKFLKDAVDLRKYGPAEVRAKFLTSTVYSLENEKAAE